MHEKKNVLKVQFATFKEVSNWVIYSLWILEFSENTWTSEVLWEGMNSGIPGWRRWGWAGQRLEEENSVQVHASCAELSHLRLNSSQNSGNQAYLSRQESWGLLSGETDWGRRTSVWTTIFDGHATKLLYPTMTPPWGSLGTKGQHHPQSFSQLSRASFLCQ